ncbi:adenine phosphoribosyltransferase [Methylophaga sp. OBS3]|uniref:adenine phosphoribosyltransferase n=1 Tax=Methylophaga sp. OBS3 TaxID=2991934 RepID=UPI00224F5DD3|nr:adenine phosphoribosyltransferase [Methylophaga sp. OBS3]MCX4189341.1 adenine phosphoribosyltransferase [Methylophaga sp. OBS3]
METLTAHIRDIPDFPSEGIIFKDITPLLRNPEAMRLAVNALILPFQDHPVTAVAGMEARGFVFGALAAQALNVGFIPLRKPGKLPHDTHSVDYELEYGSAALEVHRDAIQSGDRILIVDDVLATGGTALASCQLVEALGGDVAGCTFLLEIGPLNGRQKLHQYSLHSVLQT